MGRGFDEWIIDYYHESYLISDFIVDGSQMIVTVVLIKMKYGLGSYGSFHLLTGISWASWEYFRIVSHLAMWLNFPRTVYGCLMFKMRKSSHEKAGIFPAIFDYQRVCTLSKLYPFHVQLYNPYLSMRFHGYGSQKDLWAHGPTGFRGMNIHNYMGYLQGADFGDS